MDARPLGHGCPAIGSWVPGHWVMDARPLGHGCPAIGSWVPDHWVMDARPVGHGCPTIGSWVPGHEVMDAQPLGHGCPTIGSLMPDHDPCFQKFRVILAHSAPFLGKTYGNYLIPSPPRREFRPRSDPHPIPLPRQFLNLPRQRPHLSLQRRQFRRQTPTVQAHRLLEELR